jgi:hypothetical protein
MPPPEVGATLLRLYLQTIALGLGFAALGGVVWRCAALAGARGVALRFGQALFLGVSAFLALFVPLSRLVGAHAALWLLVAVMGLVLAASVRRLFRGGWSEARAVAATAAVAAALVAAYSVTNGAFHLDWRLLPGHEPGMLMDFGSIHTGRYANYAIFIALADRVPYLAQNGGQSILAALHLLLGVNSPLAATMAWIPFALASLTLLVFGVFRERGFAPWACAAAAALVLLCNIGFSTDHLMVFDSGSPLAFMAYSDLVISVGTFIVFCRWLSTWVAVGEPFAAREAVMPALLALTWAWYAPQNLVVAAVIGAVLVTRKRHVLTPPMQRQLTWMLALCGFAALLGALQFGPLLPRPMREDIGLWAQEASGIDWNPYLMYGRNLWIDGPFEVARNPLTAALVFGFPLLGIAVVGATSAARADPALRGWWRLSAISLAAGFLVAYFLELGELKWWLTRFMVPGVAIALVCLGFALLRLLRGRSLGAQAVVWLLVLAGATYGPLREAFLVARENFVEQPFQSLPGRLGLLVRTQGPFVFASVRADPIRARREPASFKVVAAGNGVALDTAPFPLGEGRYYAGFRVTSATPPRAQDRFMQIEVVRGTQALATRSFAWADLQEQPDGLWAWLPFELPATGGIQVRLATEGLQPFWVTDLRIRRQ